MNIPHVIYLKAGGFVAVSVPHAVCALGDKMIAKWSGYRDDQVKHVERVR